MRPTRTSALPNCPKNNLQSSPFRGKGGRRMPVVLPSRTVRIRRPPMLRLAQRQADGARSRPATTRRRRPRVSADTPPWSAPRCRATTDRRFVIARFRRSPSLPRHRQRRNDPRMGRRSPSSRAIAFATSARTDAAQPSAAHRRSIGRLRWLQEPLLSNSSTTRRPRFPRRLSRPLRHPPWTTRTRLSGRKRPQSAP